MSNEEEELLRLLEQLQRAEAENKLGSWTPIPKQMEFLECTQHRKALISGNQCGKTQTLLYELSLHLTGLYPKWWKGIRFNRPVDAWMVGVSLEKTRDNLQKALLGEISDWGTGYIPKSCLPADGKYTKKSGIEGAVQTIKIKHVSGGKSSLQFFCYKQQREDFQSSTIDIVAFDEEPPADIHEECKIRVMVKRGYLFYSFTPLEGQTEVWNSIVTDPKAKWFPIAMDDCPWHTEESITDMLHGMPEMQKRARRYGIPSVGSGQIFCFEEKDYTCESFPIPKHWPRVGGLDVGRNHPTGAVALAWDRESDSVYIYQEFKEKAQSASDVARRLKHWGVEFSTSHDAFNETFGRGETIAGIFKCEGLECFSAGRDPWARIEKVRNMIREGRLFIFKDRCPELMKEMREYRTKDDGKSIVKLGDDVIDAFTHAVFFYTRAKVKGEEIDIPDVQQWKPSSNNVGY